MDHPVTIKFTRKDEQTRFIHNAVKVGRHIYITTQRGIRPLFDAAKLSSKDQDVVRKMSNSDSLEFFSHALLLWEGTDEYTVEVYYNYYLEEFWRKKEVVFKPHDCWETGITWYQLVGRYPDNIFNILKPFLRYHTREEEEEGEWIGWALMHSFDEVNEALQNTEWKIKNKK